MKLLAPLAVIFGLIAVLIGLDATAPRADVVLINRVDIFTLDPQRMSYQADLRMATAIYEGLVRLDNRDCTFRPGVAKSWDVSPDGKVYTFHLRDDARWSNGDSVRAADFVFAWRRAILPDTVADYSNLFFAIKGVEDFFRWRSSLLETPPSDGEQMWRDTERRFSETVGLRAPDDHTLIVELVSPVAYFLDLCAFGIFCPVHPPTVEAATRIDPQTGRVEQASDWTQAGTLVSNGPYELVQWRYQRDMRLEANPHYWNKAEMRNSSVSVLTVDDPNTAVLMFESGEADWVTDVTVEYRADMLAQRRAYENRYADRITGAIQAGSALDGAVAVLPEPGRGERRNIRAIPSFGLDFYSFNCRPTFNDGKPNPFHDARVRRAFALAVDKKAIVSRITRMNEKLMSTLVPEGSIPGYQSPAGLPFDVERARAELAAAGWLDRDGDGFVESAAGERFTTVEILYASGNSRYEDISLALRDMWRQALGVSVEVRPREAKSRKDDLIRGNFVIGSGSWYGDYGDPTTWLDLSKSGDGNNDRGYSNPRYDRMLAAAAAEPDPTKRLGMLTEAERFLMEEEVPMVPLCQLVTVYMYEPGKLTGLTDHPRLEQDLHLLARLRREAK
jgi:oligopeptide transport system substrate-binding protein